MAPENSSEIDPAQLSEHDRQMLESTESSQTNLAKERSIESGEKPELSRMTDRELFEYQGFLELNPEQLAGKAILDLGSGHLQRFARQLEQRYPNTRVTCLDASLAQRHEQVQKKQKEQKLELTAGLFTHLPFRDGSFDTIVSLYGTPMYLDNFEAAKRSVEEIIRVLKRGGEARLFPFDILLKTGPELRQVIERGKINFKPIDQNKKLLENLEGVDHKMVERYGPISLPQKSLLSRVLHKLNFTRDGTLLILKKQ